MVRSAGARFSESALRKDMHAFPNIFFYDTKSVFDVFLSNVLGSCLMTLSDHCGLMWGSVWDEFWNMLGCVLEHFGMNKSSLEDPCAVLFHLWRWAGEAYGISFWKKCWSKSDGFFENVFGQEWARRGSCGRETSAKLTAMAFSS